MIEIDVPTLAVSSVILLGVTAPFISYSIKAKNAKRKFLSGFSKYAADLNLKIDLQEDWRNRYILGIDKAKRTLVYYQTGENEEKVTVPLQELSRAVVYQSYLNGDDPTRKNKPLDQLALQLHFKNPTNKVLNLEIYNQEFYSDLLGETVLAAKWAQTINEYLRKE